MALLPAAAAQTGDEDEGGLEEFLNSLQPTGIYQPNNPWLNPGFEVTLGEEQVVDMSPLAGDGNQARVVAPPTYWRHTVDDGQDSTPHSTTEIAIGAGNSGNALLINYNSTDDDRQVSLGQFLRLDNEPFGFFGADGFEFDFKSGVNETSFVVTLYYDDGDNTTAPEDTFSRKFVDPVVNTTGEWTRVTADLDVPADFQLTHAILRVRSDFNGTMLFDNVVITGSDYEPVSQQSELTDGYSVILGNGPEGGMIPPVLGMTGTGIGDFYLVSASVRDFTDIAPDWVDLAERAGVLALVDEESVTDNFDMTGRLLQEPVAISEDGLTALFAVPQDVVAANATGGSAGIWSWFDIGEPYQNDIPDFTFEAAGGYYSIPKNLLQDNAISDALDYAFTPIEFTGLTTNEMELTKLDAVVRELTGGGFEVLVSGAPTGWATDVNVSVTGFANETVTIPADGSVVSVLYSGDYEDRIVNVTGSVFHEGDSFLAHFPSALFNICGDNFTCEDTTETQSFDSLTPVYFNASESVSRQTDDANLTYEWSAVLNEDSDLYSATFGDGAVEAIHAFPYAGTYTVTLTVTDSAGLTSELSRQVEILDKHPLEVSIDASTEANRLANFSAAITSSDMDGTPADNIIVRLYEQNDTGAWVEIPGTAAGNSQFLIEGGEGEVEFLPGTFTLGENYQLKAIAWRPHWTVEGADSAVATHDFQMVNLDPVASLEASETLVAGGTDVNFTLDASDEDSDGDLTATLDLGDGNGAQTIENLSAPVTHTYADTGTYTVTLTVTDADGGETSQSVDVQVDADVDASSTDFNSTPWYDGLAQVAFDLQQNGPADASVFYSIDGGDFLEYEEPFNVTGDGEHVVEHRAVDAVGNEEDLQTFVVKIDDAGPELGMQGIPEDGSIVSGVVSLAGNATDAGIGVANTTLYIDGEAVDHVEGDEVSYEWDTTDEYFGEHTITLESEDEFGHVSSQTVTVYVLNVPDATAIPLTAGAQASGSAQNDGNNTAGMPTSGGGQLGVAVDASEGDVLLYSTPNNEAVTNGTLAYAGMLADLALTGSFEGTAGIHGSVHALSVECMYQTWGGTLTGMPGWEPAVACVFLP